MEKQHRFIRQDIPGAPLLGRLGPEPVGIGPQGVPVLRTGGNGRLGVALRLAGRRQLRFQAAEILRRRTCQP